MPNYIDKERSIINKLGSTNYEMFDGNKEEALDTMERSVNSFVKYANSVIRMEAMTPLYYARYDGQELRDKVMDLDTSRRSAHESAIANVKMLNRMSEGLGLEPFADIDTTDRHQVADFVGSYVSELYQDGTQHSMDDLVAQNRNKEFPRAQIHDLVEEEHDEVMDELIAGIDALDQLENGQEEIADMEEGREGEDEDFKMEVPGNDSGQDPAAPDIDDDAFSL